MTDTIEMTGTDLGAWLSIQENFAEEPGCESEAHGDPWHIDDLHDDGPAYWRMTGHCPQCSTGGTLLVCRLKGDGMRQCTNVSCLVCDASAPPEDWGLTLHKI